MTPHGHRRRGLLAAAAAIPALCAPRDGRANPVYPDRPIRILVPVAPGDGGDVVSRYLAEFLATDLGQPVLIENRPGGAGILGLQQTARARPDGYTLGLANSTLLAIRPHLERQMPVNVLRDITPVTLIATAPVLLAASTALPLASFADLAQAARRAPDSIAYGSFGIGSLGHLSQEGLNRAHGLQLPHVPYPGLGPAVQDLLAGRLPLLWLDPVTAAAHTASGDLRILAVAARARTPLYPSAPTVAELGEPFFVENWSGLVAPAGLPASVAERVSDALARVLRHPEVAPRLPVWGLTASHEGPAAFRRRLEADFEECGRLVRLAGLALGQGEMR